jgi:hypothetical protein
MNKSEILKKETDKLLEGVEKIELRFRLLAENPDGYLNEFYPDASTSSLTTVLDVFIREPLFFDNRSLDCIPLIVNCTLSLNSLPNVTPPECKIRRRQYEEIRDRLEQLKIDFTELQGEVEEALGGNATSLLTITDSISDILNNFIFMKEECDKIKKAMTF